MYSVAEIKDLLETVARHGLRGLDIERSGFRLRIEGRGESATAVVSSPREAAPTSPSAGPTAAHGTTVAEVTVPAGPAEDAGLHYVTSPIVGTFYRASGPDKEPFVKLGDRVQKGQTLCIVEAMKLMNEIESDVDGEIVQTLVQNAQPVEYGERLFAIRPS